MLDLSSWLAALSPRSEIALIIVRGPNLGVPDDEYHGYCLLPEVRVRRGWTNFYSFTWPLL